MTSHYRSLFDIGLHDILITVSTVDTVALRIYDSGRNLYSEKLYDSREYRPYTASDRTMKRVMLKRYPSRTESRCFRNCRRVDCSSRFSSGLCFSYSLCVGIRLVILAAVMGMEHLNYACHPQEVFAKLGCFAQHNWAVVTVRRGRGVQTTVDQGARGMSSWNIMPWGRWVSDRDYFRS